MTLLAGSSLKDWLARLETLSPRAIDLGLERVVSVLGRLALDIRCPLIHVAGTNGKGSSVAMLDALLRSAGYRVGSYTSPHIRRYNERIAVDGEPAADEDIVAAFEAVEAQRGDTLLTYFEFGTLAAMASFVRAGVDIALLEVGMGGRLDAVNAFDPDACLITNVSLDHCDWLGGDIESIAREKAGVMRDGKPAVFADPMVPDAIRERAAEIGAILVVAGRDYAWTAGADSWSWEGSTLTLEGLEQPALPGLVQLQNAAGVLALLEAAGYSQILERERVGAALGNLRLDGRVQRFSAGGQWLVDVAHNPAAAEVLAGVLRNETANGPVTAIIGMLDDKDVAGMIAPLREMIDNWVAVTAESPRAIDATELGRRVANETGKGCLVADSVPWAMREARAWSGAEGLVVVSGSFYVVAPALRELELYSRRQS